LHRDNPALQHHLSTGGTGCWIEDGSIVAGDAARAYPVVSVAGIPATLDAAILFQAQNALAATAAALEMGVPSHFVAAGLHAFEPDPDRQPAACNIVRFNGATILVDAPRQLTAMKMVARGIRHQKRRRTIVVSGCFPALSDDEARDAGRILGALGGIIILHGKRLLPERVEIVKSGVASVPVPPIVLTMPDEEHAVDQLLNTLAPDDIGLIMADEPADVLAHLWPAPSISVGSLRRVGVMVRDD
jgi:cyanophycin synthetase